MNADAPDRDASAKHSSSRRGLHPFDRRLLGRVAVARWALAADVAAGLTGTLLLLAQVTLLAAVIVARAGLARVVELSGRRTATRVMSALRAQLVERCPRPGEAQLPRTNSGELATSAGQGVDGQDTYFARYLPQVVLAVTVPVAVLLWSAAVDLQSALIMLVTLPVIPVFMTLIGRSAGARSRANWQALVVLSAHFLDVVRGLPTLRAFNRGRAQIASIHGAELTGGSLLAPLLIGVALGAIDAVGADRVFATIREAVKALEGTPAGAAGNRQTPR